MDCTHLASVVPYHIGNRTLYIMHAEYYNSSSTKTKPSTSNGYAMHGPTATSTPLLTTVHNIIPKSKTGTEYTLLPTRSTIDTLQYNGCTTHWPNITNTLFFTPYTGTHHVTCAALPQHQVRACANRVTPPGPRSPSSARANGHTRLYRKQTCTRTSTSTHVH